VKRQPKNGELSKEDFVLKAIETLRTGGYRGIHARYSGFNEAFREHFGKDSDPVGVTTAMAKAGTIEVRPCKGGVVLYKAGEAPIGVTKGSEALTKMGIA